MNKIFLVTRPRLARAKRRIIREMQFHGIWNDRLRRVNVRLALAGWAFGWIWYGGSGDIEIPWISGCRIRDLLSRRYTSLADVLRHEFGHALADTHRGLLRSRQFRSVFGAAHDDPQQLEYDINAHVTHYAATNASEDFAELFMFFLKHQGRLPDGLSTTAIARKWSFIGALCRAIRRGKRRWRRQS